METNDMAGHDAGGALIEVLVCLGIAGVNVALNDYGTGHASLIQLRDLPANIVKIDRSFIARMSELACSQQVVRATMNLAHSMGKQVVAEGVDNDAQRQLLTSMGCDLAQGWLFGQPQPFPLTRRARLRLRASSPDQGWCPRPRRPWPDNRCCNAGRGFRGGGGRNARSDRPPSPDCAIRSDRR